MLLQPYVKLKKKQLDLGLEIIDKLDNKKSDKDFIRYLRTSLGSINEVVTCLYIAKDLCYLNNNNFNVLYDSANKLSAMINSLIRKIDEKKKR